MTTPGVGPVEALTYRATVDVPARFRNSLGSRGGVWADPFQVSIREINRAGAISGCGDEMTRVMLYEAAHIILVRLAKWSWLKAD
jgi:transposase